VPTDHADHPARDPFQTLGLPPRFELTPEEVRRAYMSRIAAIHPDVASDKPLDDESDASARLHEARRVLEDPESRAGALLARFGGPGAREDRSLPPGFLMEIMELRERVESILAGEAPGDRDSCRAEAKARRSAYLREVSGLFGALSDPPTPGELGAIRTVLNAWRYIERLIEQLDPGYDPSRADFR